MTIVARCRGCHPVDGNISGYGSRLKAGTTISSIRFSCKRCIYQSPRPHRPKGGVNSPLRATIAAHRPYEPEDAKAMSVKATIISAMQQIAREQQVKLP